MGLYQTKAATQIDLKDAEKVFTESHENVVEKGGVWKLVVNNQVAKLDLNVEPHTEGGEEHVTIPLDRDSFHTHPKLCDISSDCSIQPPSAVDMMLFLNGNNNLVITKKHVYFVRSTIKRNLVSSAVSNLIKDYFVILEDTFDWDQTLKHSDYMDMWITACRYCKWFIVHRFNINPGTRNLEKKIL